MDAGLADVRLAGGKNPVPYHRLTLPPVECGRLRSHVWQAATDRNFSGGQQGARSRSRGRKRPSCASFACPSNSRGREPKEIKRNMPVETVSNFGRPLVRMLLDNYHRDRMSLSALSGFLNLKVKHIPKLEQAAGVR
jgi:hypothetical protein